MRGMFLSCAWRRRWSSVRPAPRWRWNPGTPHAYESGNCIAVASSDLTRNGLASGGTLGEGNNHPWQTGPSGGTRGEEIKLLQGMCGGQSP